MENGFSAAAAAAASVSLVVPFKSSLLSGI
jgi:hypothetical protein